MRYLLFVLFIYMNPSAFGQCQSPTILQNGYGYTVIDNFNSGLYEFFYVNLGEDTVSMATSDPDPSILVNMKPGARLWFRKFCIRYPSSSNSENGFEFIKFYNAHRYDQDWVVSNTIMIN